MGFLSELVSRFRLFFAFSTKEVRNLSIALIITAFIFSFNDWGSAGHFSFAAGLINFLIILMLVVLAYFVRLSTQRVFGFMIGFKTEFKVWWGGLVTSLLIVFITASLFGRGFTLILPGGMFASLLVRHRLGEFRYGFNYWENAMVALYGVIASVVLALIFKVFLIFFPQSWFLQKALLINIIYAICSMLPIPPLDGINVFFAGRVLYTISFGIILGISLLIYWANLWLTIVGGLIIGAIITYLYFTKFE